MKLENCTSKIIFWERTNGSQFPAFLSELPFDSENISKAEKGESFKQGNLAFTFDESVSNNGWWATNLDNTKAGFCRVSFEIESDEIQ